MSTIDWGHPGFSFVNIVEAFTGIDNTGVSDAGAAINAALLAMEATGTSGQRAFIPKGAYLLTTAISNPNKTAIHLAQGATFTGVNAASINAAGGNVVTSDDPVNHAALAISQISHETVALWGVTPSAQTPAESNYPFGMTFVSTYFTDAWDNVMHWGSNVPGYPGSSSSGPQAYWTVEQNFRSSPGVHQSEAHLEFNEPGVSNGIYRPFTAWYVHGVGSVATGLNYADPANDGTGGVSITEQSGTGGLQVIWSNGSMQLVPTTYKVSFGGTLNIQSLIAAGGAGAGLNMVGDSSGNNQIRIDGQNQQLLFKANSQYMLQMYGGTCNFNAPIGGYGTSAPLQFRTTSVSLSHGGTTTLSSGQYVAPCLQLTDTGLTSGATVVFPTTTGPTEWTVDLTGVTFGGQTVTLQVGTNTKTIAVVAQSVVRVYSNGVGKLYAWTAT